MGPRRHLPAHRKAEPEDALAVGHGAGLDFRVGLAVAGIVVGRCAAAAKQHGHQPADLVGAVDPAGDADHPGPGGLAADRRLCRRSGRPPSQRTAAHRERRRRLRTGPAGLSGPVSVHGSRCPGSSPSSAATVSARSPRGKTKTVTAAVVRDLGVVGAGHQVMTA